MIIAMKEFKVYLSNVITEMLFSIISMNIVAIQKEQNYLVSIKYCWKMAAYTIHTNKLEHKYKTIFVFQLSAISAVFNPTDMEH